MSAGTTASISTAPRSITCLLVANRGEIAIRILRTAADMNIRTVAMCSDDDTRSLHTRRADEVVRMPGSGVAAYLDVEAVVAAAKNRGCDAIHPGYGFLSEDPLLARRCAAEGIVFVGPAPETLEAFGDKVQARALAKRCGVPTARGIAGSPSINDIRAFLASLGERGVIIIKAVAGGGGRGIRVVRDAGAVEDALRRCQSEARAAFGIGDVYAEEFIPRARHVEVQIVGDGSGEVSHLGERECTIQRRQQKIVEFAPSVALSDAVRARLTDAAVRMAAELRYRNLGTFEFLAREPAGGGSDADFVFIEANPRLQVEHTVTEAVTGLDLVRIQLLLASGRSLADLGLRQADVPRARGVAIQARVNMEHIDRDGTIRPSGGTIVAFEPPLGLGVRVDAYAYAGYAISPRFDSLLAKVVVHAPDGDFTGAAARMYRALCELKVEGVDTNVGFLQNLFRHREFVENRLHTGFVDEHLEDLVGDAAGVHPERYFRPASAAPMDVLAARPRLDPGDPLAVLTYGKGSEVPAREAAAAAPAGEVADSGDSGVVVCAPMPGTIVSVVVAEGEVVATGQQLIIMEAMKMEHAIVAPTDGLVRRIVAAVDDTVLEGRALVVIEPGDAGVGSGATRDEVDPTRVRPDLAEVQARHAALLDGARPEAVARRRKQDRRMARENLDDLVDPGSFVEYGGLVVAAQRRRHTLEDLIRDTPADGLVAGIGTVNGALFGPSRARCAVLAYDYTVFAGTQGHNNHRKTDRILDLVQQARLPLVILAEGGGGRPGDTEHGTVFWTFAKFARLSGRAPVVGIASGYCFAGNAALLGCCDVIIATRGSNIGMGGPAMIEGGGLGVFRPQEIGPTSIQVKNGVIDVLVGDEAAAMAAGKKYLAYFQGAVTAWTCADQRRLRGLIPEDRRRAYDVRAVVQTLADEGSVLELRPGFGEEIITALIRIEGRPLGVIANNPMRLGGAIGSDGADKGARFMQLCDTFGLPLLSLCDTPGIMVGPEAEKTGLVRHTSRMLLASANLRVPFFAVALRKAYGIGKNCMTGGTFMTPFLSVAWPTGEFGPMNLEGAVKLAFRKELGAIADPVERRARYDAMVAELYEQGKALSIATDLGIDDVIDPADTRRCILAGLESWPPSAQGGGRTFVDAW